MLQNMLDSMNLGLNPIGSSSCVFKLPAQDQASSLTDTCTDISSLATAVGVDMSTLTMIDDTTGVSVPLSHAPADLTKLSNPSAAFSSLPTLPAVTDPGSLASTWQSLSSAHMTDQIGKMASNIPLMQAASLVQRQVKSVDAALAGNFPTPSSNADDCPDLMDQAFKAVKEFGQHVGDAIGAVGAAVGIVLKSVGDALGKIYGGIKDLLADIANDPSVKAFI